jgi:hypothetical protein
LRKRLGILCGERWFASRAIAASDLAPFSRPKYSILPLMEIAATGPLQTF